MISRYLRKVVGQYRIISDRSGRCVHGVPLGDRCLPCANQFSTRVETFKDKVETK